MNATQGPRRRAREIVFRLLYQAELTRDSIAAGGEASAELTSLPGEARAYADELVKVLEEESAALDRRIGAALEHWNFERLAATDKSVLRLGTAELAHLRGTPARVILDEAVWLARRYGREESGRFVNGVLDRLARELRPGELTESKDGMEERA
jgi:N utilization substance protein B